MICRITELQYKEVIDIADGARYGFVIQRLTMGQCAENKRLKWNGMLSPKWDNNTPLIPQGLEITEKEGLERC